MNFHGGQCSQKNVIDFSVNIPPYEPPSGFQELMVSSINKLNEYPDIDGESAKKAIGHSLKINKDQIIIGNGATELIYLVARVSKHQRVMIVEPTFTEYRRAFEKMGVYPLTYDRDRNDHWAICPYDLSKQINQKQIDTLVICNPNNPTGDFLGAEFFNTLLTSVLNKNFKIIIDESFIDFINDALSSAYLEAMKKITKAYQVLQLRSLTKTFSVAGLRIGYGVGNEDWISKLHDQKEPWSINRFALDSIPFFMSQKAYIENLKARTEIDRVEMYKRLCEIKGLTVFNGMANFLLFHCHHDHLNEELIEKNLYIRTCCDFAGLNANYYRIAVRTSIENKRLINAIKEVLK